MMNINKIEKKNNKTKRFFPQYFDLDVLVFFDKSGSYLVTDHNPSNQAVLSASALSKTSYPLALQCPAPSVPTTLLWDTILP